MSDELPDVDPSDTEVVQWACERFASIEEFSACECDCEIDLEDTESRLALGMFLDAASDQLAILSGHEIRGVCTSTITVCRNCSCRGSCSCRWDAIIPPMSPIINVTDVTFDGYTFVAEDFVIVDDIGVAWARDTDPGYWPAGKDISITLQWGHQVDEIAKNAAIELACAAARSCMTEGSRKISADQINRQGVGWTRQRTSAIADVAQKAAADNPWMAKFLALYNPKRAVNPPDVWAPEFDEVHVLRSLS